LKLWCFESESKVKTLKLTFAVLTLLTSLVSSTALAGNSTYSTQSLRIMCIPKNESTQLADPNRAMCFGYIRGVVETWSLQWELNKNEKSRSSLFRPFCDTVYNVSDAEWVRIVQEDLPNLGSGFASFAVMTALSNRLCR
jgi:predicted oxidoreductase (fatty acid repression mutant protein)